MLSLSDLERLITAKRREIEKEKTILGLVLPDNTQKNDDNNKENCSHNKQTIKPTPIVNNYMRACESKHENAKHLYEREEQISADLEKYIRRYVGLPVMLKTGEYSPNNPLLRGERDARSDRDVFIGLGEYEERKKSLRRLRQQEYREFLDQQAKKKQEEKRKAEREQQLAEERDRKRIEEYKEQERQRLEEQKRRVSVDQNFISSPEHEVYQGFQGIHHRPLSVACQTETGDFLRINTPNLTQAERELSPKTVLDISKSNPDDRPIKPALWQDIHRNPHHDEENIEEDRRKNFGEFNEENKYKWQQNNFGKKRPLPSSILDADAIHMRNIKSLEEAAERKQFYQQELKNQIEEQQRIREERIAREKMLELAEIRRLEEQLRMLGISTNRELYLHQGVTKQMKENKEEFQKTNKQLQKEIENEKSHRIMKSRNTHTSKSDESYLTHSNLPFYYKPLLERTNENCNNKNNKPFSINIPENSIFSQNYDVDSYLRKNLNPTKITYSPSNTEILQNSSKNYNNNNLDTLPIPVLRHSPKLDLGSVSKVNENNSLSDAMKVVDDKWKVPVVQKHIIKSLPDTGKGGVNILTQLGSIRRQLQLEQLKLDKMLEKV